MLKKILIYFLLILFFPVFANAATLYFYPSSGSYYIGNLISVGIYVSSPSEAMNAASGLIIFSTDKLEVVSLSKADSIFSLWVQEPTFSNSLGTINFEGVVFNPGFIGNSGKIITINFRVKKSGNGDLSFSSGSILANDGNGTNIISSTNTAQFFLKEIKTSEETVKTIVSGPDSPNVISSTHPDSNKWYSSNIVNISWEIKGNISGTRTLLNKNSNSTPSVTYEPAISEKELTGLNDGVWYFHSQLRNVNGWGDINHFKIQIDTHSPQQFSIGLIDGKEVETPQPKISFKAIDALSGIDYYNIKIDDLTIKVTEDELEDGVYKLPILSPGVKTIIVQAFDRAGNYTSAVEEITIKPLDAPIIIGYPKELISDEILIIEGETDYPESQINIYLEKNKEIILTKNINADLSGKFSFVYEGKLMEGVYKLWAEVIDNNGSKSLPSQSVDIVINKPDFIKISSRLIEFLAVIVPLVVLIMFFIFIVCQGYYKLISLKRRLRKEVFEVERTIKESFDFLREDLNNQIQLLGKTKSKRDLTKEEEKIVKNLKKDVNYLEKLMKKEIEDIKKEIK